MVRILKPSLAVAAGPSRTARLVVRGLVLACLVACTDNPTGPFTAPVNAVVVTPAAATIVVGDTLRLAVRLMDAHGDSLSGRTVAWSSTAPAKATVTPAGLVTGLDTGSARIVALSEEKSDTAVVTVSLEPAPQLIVSNPLAPPQTGTSASARIARAGLQGPGDSVTYVSLPAGTIAHGATVVVRSPAADFTLSAAMTAGGIDPVLIPAHVNDPIDVDATDSAGQSVHYSMVVARSRPPVVVRTEPPTKKVDVPLNAAIVVVFSEPMDPSSVTPQGIQLRVNGQPTGASVELAADGLRAVVRAGLAPQTAYALVITTAVRDVSGQPLQRQQQTDFITGADYTGTSSFTISPATATIPVGSLIPLTAALRDQNGNVIGNTLTGHHVVWLVDTSGAVSVTATGLVRALLPGQARVYAIDDSAGNGFNTASALITVVNGTGLDVGGVWDWTESIFVPADNVTCSDTGSYAFTQVGTSFTGTSQQVGKCGTLDNTHTDPVTSGAASGTTFSFDVGDCVYAATVSDPAPTRLSGTVVCGNETGTWLAHRAGPVGSVMVSPAVPPVLVPGNTVRLTAALWDTAGNRVFFRVIPWSSDHPETATVSDSGLVTAVAPGTATISAAVDGKNGAVVVSVKMPASIRVTTTTTGVDLDGDGYTVNVSDGQTQGVAINSVVTFGSLGVGSYSVTLTGVADNCAVAPPNPTVASTVLAETTSVAFTITCAAAGSLRVTTTSIGTDVPPAYGVQVDAGPLLTVGANGQLTISSLGARSHSVGLYEPVNCTVAGGNPRTVDITAGDTALVAFQVSCVAIGRVAFYEQAVGLVSMNADGSDRVTLPVAGYQAAWSPDGNRIAFMPLASDCGGAPPSTVVCVMNADGSGVVGLPITTTLFPGGLSWSPDGSKIAFEGAGGLYTVNVDGSGTAEVTSGILASSPAWSPDGSRIAFTCVVDAGNSDICVVNADGTGLVRLTSDPGDDHHPSWKPDGSKIAFATGRYGYDNDGNPTIAVMNPDGSGVTPIGVGDAPAWSPDGGRIAFALVPINSCDPDYGCSGAVFAVRRVDGSGLTVPGGGHYFGASVDAPAWKP